MKRHLYIIAFILIGMNLNAQSVWDGKREAIRKGNGTEADPHLIENAQNFAWLCYLINHGYTEWTDSKHFLLTTDIDLNGSEENQWIPILAGVHHKGTTLNINIDGGGHKISGLYIDNNSEIKDEKAVWYSSSASLFTNLGTSNIKNLYVEGYIHINNITCAGLAGSSSGTIENCKINVDIETDNDACGFVAYPRSGSIIRNCNNSGNIKGNGSGGIVSNGRTKIENCYNTGNIEGGVYVGGIACALFDSICYIKNSYNVGQISVTESTKGSGGIVGMTKGKIENCHYLNTSVENANENGESQTADFMRSQDFVNMLNKDTDVWCFDETNINNGFPVLSTNKNLDIKFNSDDCLTIFPNPATDHINIVGDIVSFKIYNAIGITIETDESAYGNTLSIPLTGLKTGVYFIRCCMRDGNIITKKFIIK